MRAVCGRGSKLPRHCHPLQKFAACFTHNEFLQGIDFAIAHLQVHDRKISCESAVHAAGFD